MRVLEQYDPTAEELYALFDEMGRDPVRFARIVIARVAQRELARGILSNTDDSYFDPVKLSLVDNG